MRAPAKFYARLRYVPLVSALPPRSHKHRNDKANAPRRATPRHETSSARDEMEELMGPACKAACTARFRRRNNELRGGSEGGDRDGKYRCWRVRFIRTRRRGRTFRARTRHFTIRLRCCFLPATDKAHTGGDAMRDHNTPPERLLVAAALLV